MKRRLFIGSSTEGKAVAEQLKQKLEEVCGDWIKAETWYEGGFFTLNKNALDSLVKASRKFDYGVLVATKDDIVKSRGKKSSIPRDNVMLEMGMFLGSLGLTRAFLLVEEANKLPTDYNGVTVPFFQRDTQTSINDALNKILTSIQATKGSYNLKPVPAAALALGYFESFLQPVAKMRNEQNIEFTMQVFIPSNLNDIHSEIAAYKSRNPSKQTSISDSGRPTVNELINSPNQYWDIPTTLSTLNKLMDMLSPSSEIGHNPEKQEWLNHEVRNFQGTIEVLVNNCSACKGRISIVHQ